MLADGHTQGEPRPSAVVAPDPRTRAAIWAQHKHGIVAIPKKHVDYVANLERLVDSPLVPKRLAALVQEYLSTLKANAMLSAEVLTETASELLDKYPTPEALRAASTDWLRHRLHQRASSLEEKAKPINAFLREYFTSDEVLSE
jgi:endonuclease III